MRADEAQVVHAGQAALECAGKGQRPGNAHCALDFSLRRRLYAANQADQRGFACAVAPEDADFFPFFQFEVDVV